jgi:hypothetical protein
MKNFIKISFAIIAIVLLQNCVKDTAKLTYTFYTPVMHTFAEVRAGIKADVAQPIENPGKMYVLGNTIFLAEKGKGIHIIDNSNPSSPVNKSFINIPGNEDMSVSENILYADCYTNLMAIDITNTNNIVLKKYVADIFPERSFINGYYLDSGHIITDWIRHDTTVSVNAKQYYPQPGGMYLMNNSFASSSSSSTITGIAGSMSKLAIVQNRLYAVSHNNLQTFNIGDLASSTFLSQPGAPVAISVAETIYPFQDKLFIGTTTGMNIFSIANPDKPALLGVFSHATACDPVIADNTTAFITLRSGTACSNASNQLDVVDVRNVLAPSLIKTYAMSNPKGLAKDGDILFVCDDVLKMYDAGKISDLQLKKSFAIDTPFDVICVNKIAIVTAADGLYQFDYSNPNDVKLLSKFILK